MSKDNRQIEEEKRKKGAERAEKGKSFEEKTGEIFKLKGFEVEYNIQIAGFQIDILIKKKKSIGKSYEYYVCECKNWVKPVDQDVVSKLFAVRDAAKDELKKHDCKNCDAIIVSNSNFTNRAKLTAEKCGIELYTYDELLSQLMDFDYYLTTLIQNFESEPLKKLYIDQNFCQESDSEQINGFKYVDEWLKIPGRKQVALLGDYGTGKTSFVRKLAYNMAKEYKKNPGNARIPFLLDLSQNHRPLNLETLLYDQLKRAMVEPANEKTFLTLLAEGKILLIIDSFDEMATMTGERITLNIFRELNNAVKGGAKVIFTSRTHYFKDQYEVDAIIKKQGTNIPGGAHRFYREIFDKPEYEIVYLKEFSDDQIRKYLKKTFTDKWEQSYKKIRANYHLYDLSSRPVFMDMIARTLSKLEKGKVKFNVVTLYDFYIYNWFERESCRLKTTEEKLNGLMEGLAYQLWWEGKNNIHHTDLPGLINSVLKLDVNSKHHLQTADYDTRTASLLVRDVEGNYRFAHTSFLEFLVARKIQKELETKNHSVLDIRRLSVEIIFFLHLFWDNDDKLICLTRELLEHEYKKNISENALVLFYEVLKVRYLDQRIPLNEKIEFTGKDAKEFRKYLEHQLPSKINMQTADLSGAALSNIVVIRTDFTGASLENGVFVNSTFENVTFNGTILNGGDFNGSVFRKVKFQNSEAQYCNFKDCLFEDCGFIQSNFRFSNFMNVNFHNCNREGNDFTGAGFLGSNMNMQDQVDEKNIFFGSSKPDTPISALKPLVNLGHGFAVKTVAVSSDNRFIVSGSLDNTVKLWDLESGRLINTLAGHTDSVNCVCISKGNQYIISASHDQTLKLWDLKSGCLIKTLEHHKGPVLSVFISPDSRRLVSASSDHTVKLWDLENTRLIKTLTGHDRAVNSVCISFDNQWAASGSADYTLKLWDLDTGQLIKTFTGHDQEINSVFISPDNRCLVSGSSDHTIKLWDLEKGQLIHTLQGHDDIVNSVFISPDSQQVVSGSDDHTVKLWNLQKGSLIKSVEDQGNRVHSLCISPDNRRIITGGSDYTIKRWDIQSSQLIDTIAGHNEHVESVFISPDSRQIVSGSDNHTFKFWDLESSDLIKTLKGHPGHIHFKPVFISKDKNWMVSGGLDNTLKLLDMKTNQWVYTIIQLPGNNAITLFPNNNQFFAASEAACQWFYYTDGLARYPAKDLPQLRKPWEQKNGK